MVHTEPLAPPDGARRLVVLCADDYAMTDGVSRAIEELGRHGRISATSALVTLPPWQRCAPQLASLRDAMAVGLHLNLTLGVPLAPMPELAPDGQFPTAAKLAAASLCGALDRQEIEREIARQLERFEAGVGHRPDFIDGHQHVHALPGVREALIRVLKRRRPQLMPLVRDPGDRLANILRRGGAVTKALTIAGLARGFGTALKQAGIPTNDSFAGMTDFRPQEAAKDLARALGAGGHLHLIMCHPGFPDEELAALDPVTERRRAEFDVLKEDNPLQPLLWHPHRAADGPPIDWPAEMAAQA